MSETVIGEKGMVMAPHRAASEGGAEVMRDGGNAVEAMIAIAATIAAVYPQMNWIGGDAFLVIAEPGRPPRVIDACGAAGSLATAERSDQSAGYHVLPTRGPDRGAHGCRRHFGVGDDGGSGRFIFVWCLPRRELLADAVRAGARRFVAVSRSQKRQSPALAEKQADFAGLKAFAAQFLPDGKVPETGTVVSQRAARRHAGAAWPRRLRRFRSWRRGGRNRRRP